MTKQPDDNLHARLAAVETSLKELHKSNSEILELFMPLQGGFRAIQGIGKLAALLTPLIVFGASIWAFLNGKLPNWVSWK